MSASNALKFIANAVDDTARPLFLQRDVTATSEDNYVLDEIHQITSYEKTVLKPFYGKFYKKDLSLYSYDSSGALNPLIYGTDYVCVELDQQLTSLSGYGVYAAINFLNDTIPGIVSLSYRAVGGTDNVDTAEVYAQTDEVMTTVTALAFDGIGEKPYTYPPKRHPHDIKDFYGFEHIVRIVEGLTKSVTASKQAQTNGLVPYKNHAIWLAVRNFKQRLSTAQQEVTSSVAEHIAGTAHQHQYTKEMIGLGRVQNYPFAPTLDALGAPMPTYASPATIAAELSAPPAALSYTAHKASQANPHNDTAETVGLGDVANLAFVTNYATEVGTYQNLLFAPSQEYYLAPYPLVMAINEAQQARLTADLGGALQNLQTVGQDSVNTLQATVQTTSTQVNAIEQSIQNSLDQVNTTLDQLEAVAAENLRYKLVEANGPYSKALEALLEFDYSKHQAGWSVSQSGYWPVPAQLENLYFWADVEYSGNTYRADASGNQRLTALVDRSKHQRLFVANSLTSAPLYQESLDIVQGNPGTTVGKVANFRPGQFLDQISGPVVTIQPGMTIIALYRPASIHSSFTLLTDVSPIPKAQIVAQGAEDRMLSVTTTSGWTPLKTPLNGSVPDNSVLAVASISLDEEQQCWFASSNGADYTTYPRGVDTPSSNWPSEEFQSAALTRIGTNVADSTDTGELSQLIIFNRQLSMAEAQAVVAYLRLVKSNNLAFAVDFSAQSAF